MTPHMKSLAAAATVACSAAFGQAHAASYVLDLQGVAGDIVVDSFVSGTDQITLGRLGLIGFGPPIELVQGDDISAMVTILDGPLVVPASPNQIFGFEVSGINLPQFDNSPGASVVMSGEVTFYLNGEVVRTGSGGCGNCSFVAILLAPGASFAFDQIAMTGQFLNLTSPYTIDRAEFGYQLTQPVPEPATWALWLAGLAGITLLARRRAA